MWIKNQVSVVFAILSFCTHISLAEVKKEKEPGKEKKIGEVVVTDQEWLKAFSYNFKEEFCNAKEIQICYERMTPSCMEFVHAQLGRCLKKAKLPKSAVLDQRYSILGAKIGRCVGREVNKRFLKKKTTESICQSLL